MILDIAERAALRWEVSYTHFVSPPIAADALAALNQRADIRAVAWGGYPQAERCRIAIGQYAPLVAALLARTRTLCYWEPSSKAHSGSGWVRRG